jgi:hypothetical protein
MTIPDMDPVRRIAPSITEAKRTEKTDLVPRDRELINIYLPVGMYLSGLVITPDDVPGSGCNHSDIWTEIRTSQGMKRKPEWQTLGSTE